MTNAGKAAFFGFFLFCLLSVPAYAANFRVVEVTDGDTITIEQINGGKRAKVRLYGIDCPEMGQPYSEEAKAFVVQMALHKAVDIRETQQGRDSQGRFVVIVDIPGVGSLQDMLIYAGLAWVYTQWCQNCGTWEAMQREARAQRRGLWAGNKPVPPWEWRHK